MNTHTAPVTKTNLLSKPQRRESASVDLFSSEVATSNQYVHTIANITNYEATFSGDAINDPGVLTQIFFQEFQGGSFLSGFAAQFTGQSLDGRLFEMFRGTDQLFAQDKSAIEAFQFVGPTDLARQAFFEMRNGDPASQHTLHELLLSNSPRESALEAAYLRDEARVGAQFGFTVEDLAKINAVLDRGMEIGLDQVFGKL
jgi:hypothetical protein